MLCRPAVVLSYGVAALSAIFSAFCYAEFAVEVPVAGGAFTYVNMVFGEFTAWYEISQPPSPICDDSEHKIY